MSDEKSLFNLNAFREDIAKSHQGDSMSVLRLRMCVSSMAKNMPVSLLLKLAKTISEHREPELKEESEGN